jgi:hypothetical protein
MCFTLVSVYVHTVDLVTLANILNSQTREILKFFGLKRGLLPYSVFAFKNQYLQMGHKFLQPEQLFHKMSSEFPRSNIHRHTRAHSSLRDNDAALCVRLEHT